MSKQTFLAEVERLFSQHEVDEAARQYLATMKAPKRQSVSTRSEDAKNAIVRVLSSASQPLNRESIVELLDGSLTANSVSAYANQLHTQGIVSKAVQKYAKGRTQVVYSLA